MNGCLVKKTLLQMNVHAYEQVVYSTCSDDDEGMKQVLPCFQAGIHLHYCLYEDTRHTEQHSRQ